MEKLLLNDSMNDYLTFSKYINGNDVRIVSKANEFKQKYTNEISLIKAVYEFVRDEIKHSWDIQDKRVTKSATEVLRPVCVGICIVNVKNNLTRSFVEG